MGTWRRELEEYEANLYSIRKPTFWSKLLGLSLRTKSGEMEIKRFDDGEKELEIKLHDIQVPEGSAVSVVIDGSAISEVNVNRGYARLFLNTTKGDRVPDVHSGSMAEIRFQGAVLMEGTFRPD